MLGLHLRDRAESPATARADGGPFRQLVRLFARRFLENDLLSPDADARTTLGIIVALLAAPGVFGLVWLLLPYSGPFLTPSERLLMALGDKYQFIALSMLVAALATALEWDALSIDGRDWAILGPLPIAPRRLLLAKTSALGVFLFVLAAAVNGTPAIGFPAVWLSLVPIGPVHAAWLTMVHGMVSLAAAATGFLLVVAARSLVFLACPARILRPASAAAQSALVFLAFTLLLMTPMLPADVPAELERPTALATANPAMWLLGGYERLTARGLYASARLTGSATWRFWEREQLRRERNLGPEVWAHPLPLFRTEAAARRRYHALMPVLDRLSARATFALPLLAATAATLYLLAHGRRVGRGAAAERACSRSGTPGRAWRWLAAQVVPRPLDRAACTFTLHALWRSAPQRLRVTSALGVGGALAAWVSFNQPGTMPVIPQRPTWGFLTLEYLVVFVLLVGVRRAFDVPAALEASWIFRFALDEADTRRAASGVRWAVAAGVVVPVFAVLGLVHAVAWGPWAGTAHALVGVALSLLLVEVLLAGFNRIPCTCPHVPGDGRVRWPFHAAMLAAFAGVCARLELLEGISHWWLAAVLGGSVAAAALIRGLARKHDPTSRRLTFQALPERAVQTLDL